MIELEQARGLLARAVLTMGPDFVYIPLNSYKNCYYQPMKGDEYDFEPNDPRGLTGCLIGVALSLAGETRHIGVVDTIDNLHTFFPDLMTNQVARYFRIAQIAQDHGDTWGQAYKKAEESLKTD